MSPNYWNPCIELLIDLHARQAISVSIVELKGKKAADFMARSLLSELESEGFFARLHAQKTR
jgi:hypothetical protein